MKADECSFAQIRGRMNVRGGNKAWPKSEQECFEKQIGNNPE